MSLLADDVKLARELADETDALTMRRFGAVDLRVHTKPDMTPASDADLDTETMLRGRLAERRPSDSVLGEEFGGTREFTGRQWVIDPIDGTKNFVRGVPVWATLIALLVDGVPVVGAVSAPALGRRWWAGHGHGAFTSFGGTERRISVSGVKELKSASLSFSDLTTGWEAGRSKFVELIDAVWRTRGYGDFWSYCLVAEGAVDIAVEPEAKLWDLAALDILVREAGGRFTNLAAEPGPHGGSAVATNGLLHNATLTRLAV